MTNAIHLSTHQTHIRLTIYNKKCLRIHILILRDYSPPTSLLQILQIFPGNRQSSLRGPAPLCRLKSDVLHNKKREVIFVFPRPPPPGTRPLQTIPHPRARRARLVPGIARGGMVTGKIEPCIIQVYGFAWFVYCVTSVRFGWLNHFFGFDLIGN